MNIDNFPGIEGFRAYKTNLCQKGAYRAERCIFQVKAGPPQASRVSVKPSRSALFSGCSDLFKKLKSKTPNAEASPLGKSGNTNILPDMILGKLFKGLKATSKHSVLDLSEDGRPETIRVDLTFANAKKIISKIDKLGGTRQNAPGLHKALEKLEELNKRCSVTIKMELTPEAMSELPAEDNTQRRSAMMKLAEHLKNFRITEINASHTRIVERKVSAPGLGVTGTKIEKNETASPFAKIAFISDKAELLHHGKSLLKTLSSCDDVWGATKAWQERLAILTHQLENIADVLCQEVISKHGDDMKEYNQALRKLKAEFMKDVHALLINREKPQNAADALDKLSGKIDELRRNEKYKSFPIPDCEGPAILASGRPFVKPYDDEFSKDLKAARHVEVKPAEVENVLADALNGLNSINLSAVSGRKLEKSKKEAFRQIDIIKQTINAATNVSDETKKDLLAQLPVLAVVEPNHESFDRVKNMLKKIELRTVPRSNLKILNSDKKEKARHKVTYVEQKDPLKVWCVQGSAKFPESTMPELFKRPEDQQSVADEFFDALDTQEWIEPRKKLDLKVLMPDFKKAVKGKQFAETVNSPEDKKILIEKPDGNINEDTELFVNWIETKQFKDFVGKRIDMPTGIKPERGFWQIIDEKFFNPKTGAGFASNQNYLPGTANLATFQPFNMVTNIGKNAGVPVYAGVSVLDFPVHTIRVLRVLKWKKFWKKELDSKLKEVNFELYRAVKNPDSYKYPVNMDRLYEIAFDSTGKIPETVKEEAREVFLASDRYSQFRDTSKNAAVKIVLSVIRTLGSSAMTYGLYCGEKVLAAIGSCGWGLGGVSAQELYLSVQTRGRTKKYMSLEGFMNEYLIKNNLDITPKNMRMGHEHALDCVAELASTTCCRKISHFDHQKAFENRNFRSLKLCAHIINQIIYELSDEGLKLGGFRQMQDKMKHKKLNSIKKCGQYLYALGEQSKAIGQDMIEMVVNKLAIIEHAAVKHGISFSEAENMLMRIAGEQNVSGKRGVNGFLTDYLWGLLAKRY